MNPYTSPGITEKIPEVDQIINAVCIACNVSLVQLQEVGRRRKMTEARSICAGLIFEYHPEFTLKRFGRIFNRHYSTVINSKHLFNDLMKSDKEFQRKVSIAKEFI